MEGSQKHKVVCFIEGWAVYRKEPMKFSTSKDLDPFACTHLIYAFATLDPHNFVIVPQDEDYDIVKGRYCTSGGYRSVLGMKRVNPSLKILISIGGWVEGTRKFSQMAGSAYNRREFIRSVLQFLDMYDFDGLDLDWEYPGAEDLGGRRTDKEHFSLLVEELSEVFAPRGWLLSASVSPSRFRLEDGYDVPRLNKHLDFINIMTFDLHAERDSAADHHSPLVQRKHDVGLNVFYNVKGASREKIIVGIPFYGRSFSLVNASMSWPSAPVKGFGLEGKYTQEQGFLAYFEVLELLEDNHWRKETDDVGSPYIVKGDQWIGYDNPDSIATKMSYIRKNMLEEDYKVMCYFTNWAWYRKGEGKFVPEHLDPRLCTHIVYAYASLDPNDLVIKPFDPWADIDNNFYQRITGTGRPGAGAVNVLLALGGWTDSSGDKYSRLVSNGSARRKFVTSVVAYLRRHNFRGLQLDWTYPKCWQSNCGKGPSSDKPNFTKLELKKEFKRNNPPLLLTASISGYKEVIDEAYDLPNIGRELDLLSVMTYDYHGSWERRVGHVSPLYYRQGDQFPQFNTNFTMEYLVSKGAPRKKLLVGIPFYGQSFTLESPQSYNQGAEARGPGAPGELTRQPGMLAYYEICDRLKNQRWSLERDSFGATGPYAHSGDQWVGFEDVDSVKEKAKFIRNMGYGGAMAWTLDLDDFDNRCCREPYPLLRTINRVLGLSQESAPVTGDCTKPPAPVTPVPPVLTTGSDTGEWTPSITTTTTTTTTTTPRPTTTTRIPATSPPQPSEEPSESPGTCVAGQYYPDPSNCNAFYRCILGELRKEFCATGLHWNSQSKVCDWPSEAKCGKKMPVVTPSDPEITCISGQYYPDQKNCRAFYICVNNQLVRQTCAQGLVWNQDQTMCDWSFNVKSGVFSTYPGDCNKYLMCLFGQYKEFSCAPGLHWNNQHCLTGYFKVVCYFTNWAWYRTGVGKYLPEDIDANLCTHIVYGFAVLDYENLIVKAHDSWADFDNKFYERVVAYKKKGLKVSLALGGWNDSAGDKYSRLVNSATARRKFVLQVVQFLDKYGFDGLDLDWEYPKCWQVDCDKGPDSDKASFAALVRELRQAFNPRGLLLSSAVSPSKTVIDAGYDVKTLGENLDWVAVMTYDFHGQWDKKTGHVAPLYFHEDDDFFFFNANYSINYWISEGVPRRKIVMGMPLYGQSFQLAQASTNGLNSRAPGPGQAGEFTRAAGFLAYYEICDRVKNRGWTVVKDPLDRMGPYAFKGNQWVSFDDAHMIRLKSEYIRDMDLGGGMVWALDLDDFRNRCGDGPHPLLNTIRSVLATPGTGEPGGGKFLPSDIDPELCTHIVYGFAVLNGDQLLIRPHDTWADYDNKFYEKVTALKLKGLKVLLAIGGWNDSAGDKYSRLVNSPGARARFIAHVLDFIQQHNFDGLDLDWEYPKCWQVDCKKGPDSDKEAFAALVRELSTAFKPKGLLLSSAVSPSRAVISAGYDVPVLSQYLDWIAVMTYDFHGQWDKITGHVAPMYPHPEDVDVTFNANFSIHYWIRQGADPKKIVMGMPMYGQSFSLADNSEHGLNAPTYGGGEAGEATRARGFLAYYEICTNIKKKGWRVIKDKKGRMGPYAYSRDQWVSFDDTSMIRHKAEFIKAMGLGGGMIWALDLDDFRDICSCEQYPLLRTINRVLRGYPGPGPNCDIAAAADNIKNLIAPPDSVLLEAVDEPTCGNKIFLSHSTDCNKYYLCHHGELLEQSCPEGLYWNTDHCDWPENAKCGSLQEGMGSSTSISITMTEQATTSPTTKLTTARPTTSMKPSTPGTSTDTGYKVVCYFTNWAWYRQGIGKYTPDDIDESLCTHIAYGFAVLDGTKLTIKPHDSWADIDNEFYRKVTDLKKKGLKVLVAIGGWNDSLGDKYSRLVNNAASRRKFVENVIQFIVKYNFDGLDLDWEYPKCWQVDCTKGPDSDKQGFAALVQELSTSFKPLGLLLSSAVSPSKVVIDSGYDVPALSQYFDWISVMTYDFHGHWDKQTGHNFSINYWIQQGANPKKIIMGMPLYGQSFSLTDPKDTGLNAKTAGPGEAGEFTRAGGFLAYYEICDNVKSKGWNPVRDPEGRIGPYAHKGNQWVSYDDVSDIRRKSQFVKSLGLGGGMIWALDLDDFRNRCGCGRHPLLRTINSELRGLSADTRDCT
uniref:chitinase n=1 Tax=Timema californicum TaxID=61474 RepID=A0A7R9IZZ9_TIMCA|nr:unnamed protein product [Timema californicum]